MCDNHFISRQDGQLPIKPVGVKPFRSVNSPKESVRRSFAKAISWRVVGTLDTFILSFFIMKYLGPYFGMQEDNSLAHIAEIAGYIAFAEIFTKIIIYSVHEQLWARLQWGVMLKNGKRIEYYRRTSMKMATWRVLASLDTTILAWVFTGSFLTAFSIGGLEVLTKLGLYFMHERIWVKLKFGLMH